MSALIIILIPVGLMLVDMTIHQVKLHRLRKQVYHANNRTTIDKLA